MKFYRVNLKELYPLSHDAILEVLVPEIVDNGERKASPIALICPGGGYSFVSNREKDPIAIAYIKEGYIAATLTYTVHDENNKDVNLYPLIYLQLMASIDYLRKNSTLFNIDNNKIVLVGFSAGGHLVGSYSYLYKDNDLLTKLSVAKEDVKPNYLVLGYPVISLHENTHLGTRFNITNNNDELINKLSIEKHIDSTYPPTFIWNTLEDQCVNPKNSNMLYDELKKNKVPSTLIQYSTGWHGLSLIDRNTVLEKTEREKYKEQQEWFSRMIEFLDEQMK